MLYCMVKPHNTGLMPGVGGIWVHTPLAGQIFSKSCSFSPETEFTPPNFGLKFRIFLRFAAPFVKFAPPFSKVCVQACHSNFFITYSIWFRCPKILFYLNIHSWRAVTDVTLMTLQNKRIFFSVFIVWSLWGVTKYDHVMRKPVYAYANNKGTDQPAHSCSLISAFVVRCLDSIIPALAKAELSRP